MLIYDFAWVKKCVASFETPAPVEEAAVEQPVQEEQQPVTEETGEVSGEVAAEEQVEPAAPEETALDEPAEDVTEEQPAEEQPEEVAPEETSEEPAPAEELPPLLRSFITVLYASLTSRILSAATSAMSGALL